MFLLCQLIMIIKFSSIEIVPGEDQNHFYFMMLNPSILISWQVQNAVEYLKIIGALDENENLTVLGV